MSQYLDFDTITAITPWVSYPAGWQRSSATNVQITTVSGVELFSRSGGTGTTVGCLVNSTPFTGNTLVAKRVHPANATAAGSTSQCIFHNSSGNGYVLEQDQAGTTTTIKHVIAFVVQATALQTFTSYGTGYNQTFEFRATDKANGVFQFWRNGVKIGSDFVDTTYTGLEYSGASGTGGRTRSIEVGELFTAFTLTNPVVAGGAISGTSAGAADGAGTISHGGVTGAITFAGGGTTFSGTWPLPVDGQVYPYLPVASATFTISQGGSSTTISSPLNQPAGMLAVTFGTMITDDQYYLGYVLAADGITVADVRRCYYPDTLLILPDGMVQVASGSLPRTEEIILHMANGNTYYYDLNLSAEGAPEPSVSAGIIMRPISSSAITMRALTMRGM